MKQFKLTLIGSGKSCLMNRLTSNKFSDLHDVTVGAESSLYDIKIEDKVIRL